MKATVILILALARPLASLAADDAASVPAPESRVREWQRLAGIDDTGWRLIDEKPSRVAWRRPDGIIVQLDTLRRGADHEPYLYDMLQARDHFRDEARSNHAGLVEVQVRRMALGTYDLVTTKTTLGEMSPQSAGDAANVPVYTMFAAFPMPTYIGTITLFAVEPSPTGQREALVFAARALKDPKATQAGTQRHDPYDARYDDTARYVDSDARQWDGLVPHHPLTRLRVLMPQLLANSKVANVAASVEAELAAASAAKSAAGH